MGVYYTKHEKKSLFFKKTFSASPSVITHAPIHLSHRQKYTNDMPKNRILPPQPPLFTLFMTIFGTDYTEKHGL